MGSLRVNWFISIENNLNQFLSKENIGLNSDDGLLVIKNDQKKIENKIY